MSRPHTPTIDENNEQNADPRAVVEVTAGTVPNKVRQKLDDLSSYRIHPSAIIFNSERSRGSGGKADVVQATYRLENGSDEQVVAVKKLRYHPGIDQKKSSNEFAHEVEITAELYHEHIVELIGFVEDLEDGEAWIVLPWEPNGNVSEFLATGEWEIPERVSLIKDTFEGIKYLHTRNPPICHGDLKSFNILVSSSYRAIITDFGSARAVTESEDGVEDEGSGRQAQGNPATEQAHPQIHVAAVGGQLTLTGPAWSLRWAPPEVVNGERPRLSADVWAAGWVCWEVMTNKVPFHEVNSAGAITLMVIEGEVPQTHEDAQLAQVVALCSLMADCWAFDPNARPSIAQCRAELRWMPSIPPSGGEASGSRLPSIELLLELGSMHLKHRNYEKAITVTQQALSHASSTDDQRAASRALRYLGYVYRLQSKYTQAEESFIQAQEISTRLGDDYSQARTLVGLGSLYLLQSKYTQAEESYTRAHEIFAHLGIDSGRANALERLGHVYTHQYKYTKAEEYFTRAHEISDRLGNSTGRANALYGLGSVYRRHSKCTQAEEAFTRALEIYVRVGDDQGRANTLLELGRAYGLQFKYTQSEESYTRAQEIYGRLGSDADRASVLCDLGRLRQREGRNEEASSYFVEAKDLYARIGDASEEAAAAHWLAVVSQGQGSFTT